MEVYVEPGARHRGRMFIYGVELIGGSTTEQYAQTVLRSIGFGPRLRVWTVAADLPADWSVEGKLDQAIWPAEQVWFEADWNLPDQAPAVSDPNFEVRIAAYDRTWRLYDVVPFCWADASRPARAGLAWCRGVQPYQPPPGTPPGPDVPAPPPGPGGTPTRKDATEGFPWALAAVLAAGAAGLGAIVYLKTRPKSPERGPDLYEANPRGWVHVKAGRLSQAVEVTEAEIPFFLDYQLFEPDGRVVTKGDYEGPGHVFRGDDKATWLWIGRPDQTHPAIYRVSEKATPESEKALDDYIAGFERAFKPKRKPKWPKAVPSDEWADGFRFGLNQRLR